MSRFVRHENPPYFQNYQDYRPFLRRDFRFFCAYCERNEFVLGGSEFFEIDHFRPVHLFPEHTSRYTNLYYVCGKCNWHKGRTWPTDAAMNTGFRFADPCEEDLYSLHLEQRQNGSCVLVRIVVPTPATISG